MLDELLTVLVLEELFNELSLDELFNVLEELLTELALWVLVEQDELLAELELSLSSWRPST